MRSITRLALVAATVVLPSVSLAQGLTVQSVVDMRFQGALGSIMNIAARMGGASMHDVPSTSYLSGHKMRNDSQNSGTIFDLDGDRMIFLDHKDKTYTSMTFAEMSAAMNEVMQKADKDRSKNSKTSSKSDNKDSVTVKYTVKVDRTGEHQKVAGYDAERVFITIAMEAEAKPEGAKNKEEVGSMVFLMDQWMSKAAPQIAAYTEFYKLYAQKMGTEFRAQNSGLQAAFASDARLKDGFEAAAKEMQKIQGISLRSTTHVVLLPAGVELNRQLALNEATAAATEDDAKKDEKPKGGGLRGMMGALKAAAEEAGNKDSGKDAGPPKQSTLMVLVDEVKSISTGPIGADMFAPPAGYKLEKK